MKKLLLILTTIMSLNTSYAQIRDRKSIYMELSANIRDITPPLKSNHLFSLSFVSPSKIKVYKRYNFIYDKTIFQALKLSQDIPIERYMATFSLEKPFLQSASNRAYMGLELGGGLGYEQINKGTEIINNFQLNNTSSLIGVLQLGLNAELYISRGLAIGVKNALFFSPNSTLQRVTIANGITLKFKIKNTK